MRAAIINTDRIVENTIEVTNLSDYPGAVACPYWVSIGMSIDMPEPIFIIPAHQNKATAVEKLAATDWVNQPDVYDATNTPHLTNRDELLAYRSEVRIIAVNPVEGNIDWPIEPVSVWSK
jgi:transglutaminase-like putative cysteine protease